MDVAMGSAGPVRISGMTSFDAEEEKEQDVGDLVCHVPGAGGSDGLWAVHGEFA